MAAPNNLTIEDLPPEKIHELPRLLDAKSLFALRRSSKTLLNGTSKDFTDRFCKRLRVKATVNSLTGALLILKYDNIASQVESVHIQIHERAPGFSELLNKTNISSDMPQDELAELRELLKKVLKKVASAGALEIESYGWKTTPLREITALHEVLGAVSITPLPKLTRLQVSEGKVTMSVLRKVLEAHSTTHTELRLEQATSEEGKWLDLFTYVKDKMSLEKFSGIGLKYALPWGVRSMPREDSRPVTKGLRDLASNKIQHYRLPRGQMMMFGQFAVKVGLEKVIEMKG